MKYEFFTNGKETSINDCIQSVDINTSLESHIISTKILDFKN